MDYYNSDYTNNVGIIEVSKIYIRKYLEEFIETFVSICIYRIIVGEKDFVKLAFDAFKISSILAIVIVLIEEYNQEYKSNVKSGMLNSIGTQFIKINN